MSKFLTFISLSIAVIACQRENLIPKRDFVDILVKVYLTDATVLATDLKTTLYYKDTIDYYSSTYKSFGYTKAQFDSTLAYYSRNPKEFDIIFDKVINELSKMETKLAETEPSNKIQSGSNITDSTNNLWNLKTSWAIPEDGIDNHINFDIPVKGLGKYTISGEFQVFDDDKSDQPRILVSFYYDDKTPTGKRAQTQAVYLQQDGVSRKIEISLDLTDPIYTHFSGCLLDNGNNNGKINKHVLISNLQVKFVPQPRRIKPIVKENLQSAEKKELKEK